MSPETFTKQVSFDQEQGHGTMWSDLDDNFSSKTPVKQEETPERAPNVFAEEMSSYVAKFRTSPSSSPQGRGKKPPRAATNNIFVITCSIFLDRKQGRTPREQFHSVKANTFLGFRSIQVHARASSLLRA